MVSTSLSVKYFLLFKLATSIFWATSNVVHLSSDLATLLFALGTLILVNLGLLVFNRLVQHAEMRSTRISLMYPCLISSLIARASYRVLPKEVQVQTTPMTLSTKLFHVGKVHDLPVPPPARAAPSSAADATAATSSAHPAPPTAVFPHNFPPQLLALDLLSVAELRLLHSELWQRAKSIDGQIDDLLAAKTAVSAQLCQVWDRLLARML